MIGATLCSGIGAPEVAGRDVVDWQWTAEIEAFPSAVLTVRTGLPNLGDITSPSFISAAKAYSPLDLLVAGTPCQAFSVAGLRASLADHRGNLTLRFVEIIHELKPRVVLWENVPGILSTKDNAFGCFLGGLVGSREAVEVERIGGRKSWPRAGFLTGPAGCAAWRVLDAQYFNLAQRRARVFVVWSATGSGVDPREVLFEREGVQRDTAPGRSEREGVTGCLSARTKGGGGLGTDFDLRGGLVEVCPTLRAGGNRTGGDRPPGTDVDTCASLIAVVGALPPGGTPRGHGTAGVNDQAVMAGHVIPIFEAGSRTGKSTDDPRAGMGIGEPGDPMYTLQGGKQHAVAFHQNQRGEVTTNNIVGALNKGGGKPGQGYPAIAFSSKDYGADAGELAPTLRSMGHDKSHPNGGGQVAVAFQESRSGCREYGSAGSLRANGPGHDPVGTRIRSGMAVRRLTPTECERLQGFPDDYTNITYRGRSASDGPRYKVLGNAMAVPVIAWIIERIGRQLEK